MILNSKSTLVFLLKDGIKFKAKVGVFADSTWADCRLPGKNVKNGIALRTVAAGVVRTVGRRGFEGL
jgi:hypothetical protein